MTTQSEYRPTEYMQGWMQFWFDDAKRLEVAKQFQISRIEFIKRIWVKDRNLKYYNFHVDDLDIHQALEDYTSKIPQQTKVGIYSLAAATTIKQLYKIAAIRTGLKDFSRNPEQGDLPMIL